MYIGPMTCPRCGGTHWHRDHKATSATGVYTTRTVCVRCSERLEVRSTKEDQTRCLIVRRWSLYSMGRLKPVYREWVKREPEGIPYYQEGKRQ